MTDIIIVTYNAKQSLARCLRSVIQHTKGLPYQLTVVDNASLDGTSDFLKRNFPGVGRLIQSPRNHGFSGGANLALRNTHSPWVVLLDDDAEVSAGWIGELHGVARRHPDAGIVGGKVVFPDGRLFGAEVRMIPFGTAGWGEVDRGQRDYTREVDALPGPCWLMRRSVIEKVGPFDERFFPCQYEDIDYCVRVRLAGYKIFYHGKVKIIHGNLFRSGPGGTSRPNEVRFFKKWGKVLSRFPLCPLNAREQLILQGAKLLRQEEFCFTDPLLGKMTKVNRWLPENLYLGISHWASGHKKKAIQEFRGVSEKTRVQPSEANRSTLYLHQVLSVYFSRLGLEKEAARHTASIMDFLDQAESPAKSVMLALHRWRILITSDDLSFFEVLRRFLPYYARQFSKQALPGGPERPLEILFSNQTEGYSKSTDFLSKGFIPSHSAEYGIYRMLDVENRRVFATMTRRTYFRDNWILHGSFLWPLEHLLRLEGASLVHGAFLEKNGQGILILGEKGAGKSTLSTACMNQGYRYFSDEHPILEIRNGKVLGKSFINPIALPAISTRNFPGLKNQMVWSKIRRKYLLEPEKVWPDRLGEVASVTKVVFPTFSPRGTLSVKRLSSSQFLELLLKDEYLGITLPHEKARLKKSVPHQLAVFLCQIAAGFKIDYGRKDIFKMPSVMEGLQEIHKQ